VSERPEPRPAAPVRRRFDPGAVVTGVFFLAMAGLFLADALTALTIPGPAVMAPVILVGLGLVGIVRILPRGRRRSS
jgi:hypothetical protein